MTSSDTASDSAGVLKLSARRFRLALLGVWLGVLVVQAAVFLRSQISGHDACGAYLPLARAASRGDWDHAQSVMFPPAYPIAVGLLARALPAADDPEELAGAIINLVAMHVILACVAAISLKLFSRRAALVAVGLAGLNPRLVQLSATVSLEPSFAAVCALAAAVLILTREEPRWWTGPVLGLLGGAGGLLRSEGILLPGALMLGVLICYARRGRGTTGRAVAAAATIAVVSAAMWVPRVAFVHRRTGYALPDLRGASFLGADPRSFTPHQRIPLAVKDVGATLRGFSGGALLKTRYSPTETPGKWIGTSLEGLATGWNPAAIALGLFGLIWRAPLRRRGRAELVLGVLVGMQLLGCGVAVYLNPRLVAVVAPFVAVFAGVGAVALAERILRRARAAGKSAWWALGVRNLNRQLVLVGLLLLICAAFCVRRAQRKHVGHRRAGEFILRRYGPDRPILARTPQAAYYSRGRLVPVLSYRTARYANADIASILRQTGAAFVLLDGDRRWCPGLAAAHRTGALAGAVIPLPPDANGDLVLFDAGRLAAILAAAAPGGG